MIVDPQREREREQTSGKFNYRTIQMRANASLCQFLNNVELWQSRGVRTDTKKKKNNRSHQQPKGYNEVRNLCRFALRTVDTIHTHNNNKTNKNHYYNSNNLSIQLQNGRHHCV